MPSRQTTKTWLSETERKVWYCMRITIKIVDAQEEKQNVGF